MSKNNNQEELDFVANKKTYKNLSPAAKSKLFRHISFNVAQNYKLPVTDYIFTLLPIVISIAIFAFYYIFNEETAGEILSSSIKTLPPATVIIFFMYKISNKRKSDIL